MTNNDQLWDWSLAVYGREGMPALCLQAQDQHGADVCLLLCALWLERHGVMPKPARLAMLIACAADWRERVVQPLRAIRRDWKDDAAGDERLAVLRSQLQQLEIDAEHVLLDRLQALAADWPSAEASADWLKLLLPQLPADLGWQLRRLAHS